MARKTKAERQAIAIQEIEQLLERQRRNLINKSEELDVLRDDLAYLGSIQGQVDQAWWEHETETVGMDLQTMIEVVADSERTIKVLGIRLEEARQGLF